MTLAWASVRECPSGFRDALKCARSDLVNLRGARGKVQGDVWIVDVGRRRLFIQAQTKDARSFLPDQIGKIVKSIRFD